MCVGYVPMLINFLLPLSCTRTQSVWTSHYKHCNHVLFGKNLALCVTLVPLATLRPLVASAAISINARRSRELLTLINLYNWSRCVKQTVMMVVESLRIQTLLDGRMLVCETTSREGLAFARLLA